MTATGNSLTSIFDCPNSGEQIKASYDRITQSLLLRPTCTGEARTPNPDALRFVAAFEGQWDSLQEVVRALELAGVENFKFRHDPADRMHHLRSTVSSISHKLVDGIHATRRHHSAGGVG